MSLKYQLTASDPLEYDEFQRLLQRLHQDKKYRWELLAWLSFCTACRISDTLKFTWKEVLDKNLITIVESKTKKARMVEFSASARKKILELYNLLGKPDVENLIFKTARSKEQWTIQYINRELKKFKLKYGIKIDKFSTHTFRKTLGRYFYEKNNRSAESLLLLNMALKHSSLRVTTIYLGITKDEIQNIYRSIAA